MKKKTSRSTCTMSILLTYPKRPLKSAIHTCSPCLSCHCTFSHAALAALKSPILDSAAARLLRYAALVGSRFTAWLVGSERDEKKTTNITGINQYVPCEIPGNIQRKAFAFLIYAWPSKRLMFQFPREQSSPQVDSASHQQQMKTFSTDAATNENYFNTRRR